MGLNQWVELRYLGYYHRGSVVFQIRRVLNQGPRECGAEPCKAWRLLLTPRPRPAAAKERRAGRRIGFVLRNRKKVVSACTAAVDSQKPSQTWLFLGAKKTLQCLYSRCTSDYIRPKHPKLAPLESIKNSAVLVQPLYIRSKREILVIRP